MGGALGINAVGTAGKLTITNATDARRLVISGEHASRGFIVNNNADLTLNSLTVADGSTAGGAGGNINANTGSTLTLNGVTVRGGNTTGGLQTAGGGIYAFPDNAESDKFDGQRQPEL